jgi:hypothetical protein
MRNRLRPLRSGKNLVVVFARPLAVVIRELDATRGRLADTAESVARVADAVAMTWEQAASRGDGERRSAMAAWHREIARVERHNAAALRGSHLDILIPIPSLGSYRARPVPESLGDSTLRS